MAHITQTNSDSRSETPKHNLELIRCFGESVSIQLSMLPNHEFVIYSLPWSSVGFISIEKLPGGTIPSMQRNSVNFYAKSDIGLGDNPVYSCYGIDDEHTRALFGHARSLFNAYLERKARFSKEVTL